MKLTNRFTYTRLPFDTNSKTHLVCTLEAPKQPESAKRTPICVVPAIDLSGSMHGQKLEYVKNSLYKLVEHLTESDYLGLVGFNYEAKTISPIVKLTSAAKDELKLAISRLSAGGGTNMGDGISKALQNINSADIGSDVKSRVVVFTDGQSNQGLIQSQDAFVGMIKSQKGRASVSAFGYGTDANPILLTAISKDNVGDGNYAYIQSPDDALTAFGKELGGLISVYAENIELELTLKQGNRIVDVLSDVDSNKNKDGTVIVKIKQLLFEETRDLVFELACDKKDVFLPREVSIGSTEVRYAHLTDNATKAIGTQEAPLKLSFVKHEIQTAPDKDVDAIVGRAELAKAQLAAEEAAKNHKYDLASGIFTRLAADFAARGYNGLAALSGTLSSNYANVQAYTASAASNSVMYSAVSSGNATRSYTKSAEINTLLKDAGVITTSNTASVDLMNAFTAEEEK